MQIRTKIRLGTIATTIFTLLFVAIFVLFAVKVNHAYQKQKIVEKIVESSFQSALLRSDYIKYPSDRSKAQLLSIYESRERLFAENAQLFSSASEKKIFEEIVMLAQNSDDLLRQLFRNVETGAGDIVVQEVNNQLTVKAQSRIAETLRLADLVRQETTGELRSYMFFVVILGLLVAGMVIALQRTGVAVAWAIQVFGDGTRNISAGDFSHRFSMLAQDEIGDLGRAMNAMAEKLRSSYQNLEERVRERTADLEKSNAFLDAIIENIPNMIFLKDAKDLRFVRFNAAGESLLGYPRTDLLGKNDYDFFPKDQADFFTAKDREVLKNGILKDIPEESIQTKLNGERWLHTKKIPINDADGKPQYLLGISEDITEAKRKEAQISAIHEALEKTALVSMTDAQGDIVYANDRFTEISGYSRDELVGRNHRILKSGQQPQSLFDDLWKTVSGGKVWHGEILDRAKDGSFYWTETSIAPILDDHGKPERYISVRFLITEQKNAMREIQKFQEAVDASTDAIAITSPDLAYIYVNPAWEHLTGYAQAEVIGRTPEIILSDKTDPELVRKLLNISSASADQQHAILHSDLFIHRRKDGSEYNAERSVYPIREKGKVAFYVFIHRDISARMRTDLAKSEFISLASHQLRTPLTGIRWALSVLDMKKLTKEQRHIIESAHTAAANMSETIKAMLSISHLEAGDIEPEFEEVDLRTVLENVADVNDLHRKQNGLKLKVECPKNLRIRTDAQLLLEVLDNFLSNAYKYTPKGGNVNLCARREGKDVRIDVADTGYGIPLEEQARVAEKFFRASNVVGKAEPGTGIGLYLAYTVARLIGGSISFVSEEDYGATFTLFLPSSIV